MLSSTDARNGAATYGYNNADQTTSVTAPALGDGEAAQATTTAYSSLGRALTVTQPDGTILTNEYFVTGLRKKVSGSRTYPVEYTYDPVGRMKTMKTWQDFAGNAGTATTTWNYQATRGWLSSKDYPDPTTGQPPAAGMASNTEGAYVLLVLWLTGRRWAVTVSRSVR